VKLFNTCVPIYESNLFLELGEANKPPYPWKNDSKSGEISYSFDCLSKSGDTIKMICTFDDILNPINFLPTTKGYKDYINFNTLQMYAFSFYPEDGEETDIVNHADLSKFMSTIISILKDFCQNHHNIIILFNPEANYQGDKRRLSLYSAYLSKAEQSGILKDMEVIKENTGIYIIKEF
jgi:hypothetical protein